MAQLKPALNPSGDLFWRPRPQQPPSMSVGGNIDKYKSFKIDHFLKKRTVKKDKGLAIEYLVR